MVARALWRSEALRVVPWLRPYGSCRVSDQGTTLRASDLHNARATILNPFIIFFMLIESRTFVNSLWPSDIIWRQGSRSTLAQVMACCLTAPSHYLNQCWLMISEVLWHSPDRNFTEKYLRHISLCDNWEGTCQVPFSQDGGSVAR